MSSDFKSNDPLAGVQQPDTGDVSATNPAGTICPVTRLPVETRPEWTGITLSGDRRLDVKVIGKQILYTRPTGFVSEKSIRQSTAILEQIIKTSLQADRPFVWVSNYTGITGISMAARKLFSKTIAGWSQIHAMILFGASPFVAATAKLGARFKVVPFPVHIARSHAQAMELAAQILKSLPFDAKFDSQPSSVLTDETWKLEIDDYSIRFEVLDGSIIHSIQKGPFTNDLVQPIFDLRDEVIRAAGLRGQPFSILAGMEEVEKSSHAGRVAYTRRMSEWYHDNPFLIEVFYGLNPLMRTVITVSSLLTPFKVHVAKNFEEGRRYILNFVNEADQGPSISISKQTTHADDIERIPISYIDELQRMVASISWGTDEADEMAKVEPDHPLAAIYGALGLVRTEIDDLLIEQMNLAAESQRLQERLARSEKMEALGLLAGGVAHDLNNILSGIVSYPEILLLDEDLSPAGRQAIETIQQSGDQAAAVVNDLMSISRGVATKTVAIILNSIVEEFLNSPDFATARKLHPGTRIDAHLESNLKPVLGSRVNLRKVIANLVLNALEAIGPEASGGLVKITTFQRQADDTTSQDDEHLPKGEYSVLRVSDNGPGIEAGQKERIFEPFFTKKIMGRSGTGLGLTVVWNTVRNHGGFIDLQSSDEGTCFDVFFPITEQSLPKAPISKPAEDYRGMGQRILIVDDEPSQREIATIMLRRLGYHTEHVPDGEAAIEKLRDECFDLILLDMLMEPGINGRETFERMLELRPEQKAIIVSGFAPDNEVKMAQELGAGSFVAKPYSLETIGIAIHEALKSS